METQASRLLSYTFHVYPTFIPTSHTAETSQEDSLHKAYIACLMFRGKDSAALHKLFRDSLQELYDMLFDIDADALAVPEDYYSAIAEASELAGWRHTKHRVGPTNPAIPHRILQDRQDRRD